jgi:hypothetical protein
MLVATDWTPAEAQVLPPLQGNVASEKVVRQLLKKNLIEHLLKQAKVRHPAASGNR